MKFGADDFLNESKTPYYLLLLLPDRMGIPVFRDRQLVSQANRLCVNCTIGALIHQNISKMLVLCTVFALQEPGVAVTSVREGPVHGPQSTGGISIGSEVGTWCHLVALLSDCFQPVHRGN